jgi:hypothetical protein
MQGYNHQIELAFMVQTFSFDMIPPDINGVSRVGEKLHSGLASIVVQVNEQNSLLIRHAYPRARRYISQFRLVMQDRKRVALLSRGLMDICYALAGSAAMVSPVFLKLDAGFLDLQGCRLGLFQRHNELVVIASYEAQQTRC